MQSLTPFTKICAVAFPWWCRLRCVLLAVLALFSPTPVVLRPLTGKRRGASHYLRPVPIPALMLCLLSPWLLCGCGTVRSVAPTPLPVPAVLMQPPSGPTLLMPKTVPALKAADSTWTTPGATSGLTPKAAPLTGDGIKP